MFQATGDEVLGAAARSWIDHALALRCDAGIAGFPMVHRDLDKTELRASASMLTGASGVALVLHAAISDIEPCWDRLLLADLPLL